MIDISKLTERDKGRGVYIKNERWGRTKGVITGWGSLYISVCCGGSVWPFSGDPVARPVRPEDLEWEDESPEGADFWQRRAL